MKRLLLAIAASYLIASPAKAQEKPANLPAPALAPSTAPTRVPVSLSRYLQMQPDQLGRLDRIYDGYAARRREQESKIIVWQDKLRLAQSPTNFNEKQATSLQRDISEAQQKVLTDFLSCRAKALEVLPPVQRSQLKAIATDPRFDVSQNAYYELLLMPVEDVWETPSTAPNAKYPSEPSRRSNNGLRPSVDVYGGYGSGGPQYGVGVGAGRGPIGAHVGIGRGGPSFGIGIGGIFSGRRW